MALLNLLSRSLTTAIKLPAAMAWDVISLGNMGDGSSTEKVLREHQAKARVDDLIDVLEKRAEVERLLK